MRILLTEKQDAMLKGMFEKVDSAWSIGSPGMIVGQFFESDLGPGFFEVGFIDGDNARPLLKAMGVNRPELADPLGKLHYDVE